MKLVYRLSYFLHPGDPEPGAPVLLFLHGIGQGFINRADFGEGFVRELEVGHQNLLKQGPLKHLETLSENHPLRRSFTVVAPQLPNREISWGDKVDDLEEIVGRHGGDKVNLYIMGFSKGGLGAFQVATALKPKAMVTIDAAPMTKNPEEAINKYVKPLGSLPIWAVYTNYADVERFRPIFDFGEMLGWNPHDFSSQPAANSQWRSQVQAPSGKDAAGKHTWICDEVSKSSFPYQWLLQHDTQGHDAHEGSDNSDLRQPTPL